MIDVEIRSSCPGCPVVGRHPGSGRGSAGRVHHDVGAVALEDRLARVAGPRDGIPRGEEVAGIAVLGAGCGDGEACEESFRRCRCRDVGWRAGGDGRGGDPGTEEESGEEESGMHPVGGCL